MSTSTPPTATTHAAPLNKPSGSTRNIDEDTPRLSRASMTEFYPHERTEYGHTELPSKPQARATPPSDSVASGLSMHSAARSPAHSPANHSNTTLGSGIQEEALPPSDNGLGNKRPRFNQDICFIDGWKEKRGAIMLVDTGAEVSVMSSKMAERGGFEIEDTTFMGRPFGGCPPIDAKGIVRGVGWHYKGHAKTRTQDFYVFDDDDRDFILGQDCVTDMDLDYCKRANRSRLKPIRQKIKTAARCMRKFIKWPKEK